MQYTYNIMVFGPQAQTLGTRLIHIVIEEPQLECKTLNTLIAECHPDIAPTLPASRIACNHEFTTPEDIIHHQDEIAIIGMISGG